MKTQSTKSRFDRNIELFFFVLFASICIVCTIGAFMGHYWHIPTAIVCGIFAVVFNPWSVTEW